MTDRDRLRQQCADRGAFYNPWLHLGVTSVSGFTVMGLGVAMIHELKWWQGAFGVALFILSNAAEWRLHRDVLHKRLWFAAFVYDRHTPAAGLVRRLARAELLALRIRSQHPADPIVQ